jgi:hypothetical protein
LWPALHYRVLQPALRGHGRQGLLVHLAHSSLADPELIPSYAAGRRNANPVGGLSAAQRRHLSAAAVEAPRQPLAGPAHLVHRDPQIIHNLVPKLCAAQTTNMIYS